jgi:hypothetical protein
MRKAADFRGFFLGRPEIQTLAELRAQTDMQFRLSGPIHAA